MPQLKAILYDLSARYRTVAASERAFMLQLLQLFEQEFRELDSPRTGESQLLMKMV